jgi:hypothetical protein
MTDMGKYGVGTCIVVLFINNKLCARRLGGSYITLRCIPSTASRLR